MNILRWGVVCLLLLVGFSRPEVFAQEGPGSLQELLDQVRAERQADSKLHGERESRFLAERDQRQSLLQQAESELAGVKQQSEEKQAIFRQNEDNLVQLRSQLKERAASLGELFGVVRQISRDTAGMIEGSFVSVQSGDRVRQLPGEPRVGQIQGHTAYPDTVFRGESLPEFRQEVAAARDQHEVHAPFGQLRGKGGPEPFRGARHQGPFPVAGRQGVDPPAWHQRVSV